MKNFSGDHNNKKCNRRAQAQCHYKRDASSLFKPSAGMLIPLEMNDTPFSDPVIRIIMLQCRLITPAQEANKSHSMGHKCTGFHCCERSNDSAD